MPLVSSRCHKPTTEEELAVVFRATFPASFVEAARARGESGSNSKTNSAEAPAVPAASRERLRVHPFFIVSPSRATRYALTLPVAA
jgi:hypothetical protein